MDVQFPEVVDLNVGGMHFTTTRSTLTECSGSKLAAMFSGNHEIHKDKEGRYMIDCDGKIFSHILEFLRVKTLPPSDVSEAVFRYSKQFQLLELSEMLCKFQPVNHALQITNLKERNPMYSKLADKMIECLSTCITHKDDTVVIVVHRDVRTSDSRYRDNEVALKQEFMMNIQPLTWLEVGISSHEIDLWQIARRAKDEIFFLTANQLQTLGYGSNILYFIDVESLFYGHDLGLFLICKDNVFSRLHKVVSVKFQQQPLSLNYSY